jgi:hypothetical protein
MLPLNWNSFSIGHGKGDKGGYYTVRVLAFLSFDQTIYIKWTWLSKENDPFQQQIRTKSRRKKGHNLRPVSYEKGAWIHRHPK